MLKGLGKEMYFLESFADGQSWGDLGELMYLADRLQMLQDACEYRLLGVDKIE